MHRELENFAAKKEMEKKTVSPQRAVTEKVEWFGDIQYWLHLWAGSTLYGGFPYVDLPPPSPFVPSRTSSAFFAPPSRTIANEKNTGESSVVVCVAGFGLIKTAAQGFANMVLTFLTNLFKAIGNYLDKQAVEMSKPGCPCINW